MPRSILTSATSSATVAKRQTIRLPQSDWDRLAVVQSQAEEAGMALDIDGALADYLRRQIAAAEKTLAQQRQEPAAATSSAEDNTATDDDTSSSGWPHHG